MRADYGATPGGGLRLLLPPPERRSLNARETGTQTELPQPFRDFFEPAEAHTRSARTLGVDSDKLTS